MTDDVEVSELETLKAQADVMGIRYGENIGVETLRKRIADRLGNSDTKDAEEEESTENASKPVSKTPDIKAIRDDALRLIRVRVVPMDSNKRDYHGDVFSAGNNAVPTVKRYIPFNEITHIENILYKQLKAKKYLYFVSKKHPNGVESRESRSANAYNIEVLPPLTPAELEELKKSQLMRGSID